jgi:hypothetical protein
LRRRSAALFLMATDSPHVADALASEMQVGLLRVKNPEIDPDPKARDAYLTAEALVLLHHASETLIRLYRAHSGSPACPWIEISRRTHPGDLPKWLSTLPETLDTENALRDVMTVFRGYPTFEATAGMLYSTEEEWNEQSDGLVALLKHLAYVLVQDAPVYNAAKHGLAALAGESSMGIGQLEDPVIFSDGPSISVLRVKRETDTWHQETTWISQDGALATTFLVANQIESLWSIARNKYLDEPGGALPGITPEKVQGAIHPAALLTNEPASMLGTLGIELSYYANAPAKRAHQHRERPRRRT